MPLIIQVWGSEQKHVVAQMISDFLSEKGFNLMIDDKLKFLEPKEFEEEVNKLDRENTVWLSTIEHEH